MPRYYHGSYTYQKMPSASCLVSSPSRFPYLPDELQIRRYVVPLHDLACLPYRWAACGDRPRWLQSSLRPHPTAQGHGEATVMSVERVALERKVSSESYPGFKSTPRLETPLEARVTSIATLIPRATREPFECLTSCAAILRESPRRFTPRQVQPNPAKIEPLGRSRQDAVQHPFLTALWKKEAAAVSHMARAGAMVRVFTADLSLGAAGAQVRRPSTQNRVVSINREALPLWALSMLAGLSVVVDSLSDNVTLNLGMGIVHFVVLKMWKWRG
ncbi:hypothetical protein EDB83DRAFT_2557596 [Lactarius deliciosus]|nr:hypothetical protein EDB83DRAFT_2557596 [Lactarius deliciosus]